MDLFLVGGGGVYWPLSMLGVDKGWEINSRCPYCWMVGGGGGGVSLLGAPMVMEP